MENASRALIMAATVLLGVLLITMFVYIFREGSQVSKNYDIQQQANQLELYNSKFEYYNRPNNTIMDIISVCNLAFDVNDSTKTLLNANATDKNKYSYDDTNAIEIKIMNGSNTLFSIPNVYDVYSGKSLKKNQILKGSEVISIYDLASKYINYPQNQENSLKITGLGNSREDDKLSTTKWSEDENKTIYEYLFKCNQITYKEVNGQVGSMEFEIYKNDEY